MFDALKPSGTLSLPITWWRLAHRSRRASNRPPRRAIEKQELQAAGFRLVDEGNFLRAPGDTHDFPIFGAKVPIDIYVLKFQKP